MISHAILPVLRLKRGPYTHLITAFGCFLLLSAESSLWGQVSATLSGTVSDPSGAIVSGAGILVKNEDTGAVRKSTTDGVGRYQLSALPVGHYEVRVNQPGFADEIRTGINLVVGEDARVDLTLRLGTSSQQVTVNEDAPLVNATTADIAGLVGEQQIVSLPLNGRSYDELLTLNPGVVNLEVLQSG